MVPPVLMSDAARTTLRPRLMFSPKVCKPVVVTDAPLSWSVPPALVFTLVAVTAPPKVVVDVLLSCTAPRLFVCPTPPDKPIAPAPALTVNAVLPE